MNRYALKIEYDGTHFHGWQKQKNLITVQGSINSAVEKTIGNTSDVVGAGRTDTGVHAIGQVAHVDIKSVWPPKKLENAINYHIKPNAININDVKLVDENFHARFSAIKRYYVYRIFIKQSSLTFDKNLFWRIRRPLNIDKMKEAASHLIGTHDFTTFRSSMCQSRSPIKTLDKIQFSTWKNDRGSILEIELEARSFLHNQVRSIVGTLHKVGEQKLTPDDIKIALLSRNRQNCGPVAPPRGLYLKKIDYKTDLFT